MRELMDVCRFLAQYSTSESAYFTLCDVAWRYVRASYVGQPDTPETRFEMEKIYSDVLRYYYVCGGIVPESRKDALR